MGVSVFPGSADPSRGASIHAPPNSNSTHSIPAAKACFICTISFGAISMRREEKKCLRALWCAYGPSLEMQAVIRRRGEDTPPYGNFYRKEPVPLRFPRKNQKAGDP